MHGAFAGKYIVPKEIAKKLVREGNELDDLEELRSVRRMGLGHFGIRCEARWMWIW